MTDELNKLAAFVAPETEIAGLKLRPLSAGTLIQLKLTHNPLIDGLETAEPEYHVASFLYIHSAPPGEVRRATANPEVFRDKVLEFADRLSIPDFVRAAQQIQQLVESATVGNDYEVKTDEASPSPNA